MRMNGLLAAVGATLATLLPAADFPVEVPGDGQSSDKITAAIDSALTAAEQPFPTEGAHTNVLAAGWTLRKSVSHEAGKAALERRPCADAAVPVRLGDWRPVLGDHFSGTAVYRTTFDAETSGRALLDLGRVCWTCSVTLNGQPVGTRFFGPYRFAVDVKKGENVLEVTVANLLANALSDDRVRDRIGRDFPPLSGYDIRQRPFDRDNNVSGLFGPVTLVGPMSVRPAAKDVRKLKVLAVGNSFSWQLPVAMPPVAKALGLELDICALFIGGCSLETHWKNVCAPETKPYRVIRNRFGVADKDVQGNIPDILASEPWDVITVQQVSGSSWVPETYHPWGDDLVKYIREKAPQAKILVQETWSYTAFDKRFAKWGIDQDIMYEKLKAAYAAFAGTYGFDIIPTGTAVQLVRKDLPVRYAENSLGGDVVGDMRFSKKDGKWEAIGDAYHMGPDGDYLQALVWTAKLFGVDVTACTYAPPGMTAERAAFLRKTAMKAVAIKETTDFNITDYGAKPNGEKCTAAIARTIDACSRAGGGRVVVPAGRWRTGGVKLRSNCELHLAEGAVLEFSDDLDDYLPGVPVSWEGVECVNVSPLVYAYGCTNVAVTGRGTLKAKMDFWWTWAGPKKPDCEVVNRKLKNEWSPKNVPVAERQLWKEPNARFRPQFLHFNRCRGVRLEGFSVRGSPFWTIHAFLCDGVTARGLDVDATGDDGRIINNSDGFDIDATKNVLIEDCTFCQGDDALVFKSGKDFDGRRLATPTENVVVRNCTVRRGHNLAAIGSELSGGVRNIRISGCRITGAVGELLHIKTNPRRGGFVENVVIEDVEVDELRTDVLGITSRYYFGGSGEEAFEQDFLTPIRNIDLRDIRCSRAARCLTLRGDYLLPVENVSLRDVRIASCGEEDYIASVRNLSVDGRTVEPTIRVLTAADLGGVDVSKAIYQPESRDSVLAFTDGTVKGTVVRASRDLKTWSEPVAELWPEDEFKDAKVKSAKIRRETDGWYMDVEFAGEKRTYYTPEVFWPFKPKSCFK